MATRLSKQLILHELKERADEVRRRFQVNQLGLFGSYVREQANAESDIDILVDFVTPTFDNYMNLKFYLEEIFGHAVDLVTIGALKPRLKPAILSAVHFVEIG